MTDRNICVFKTAVTVHNEYTPEMLDSLWSRITREKSSCHRLELVEKKNLREINILTTEFPSSFPSLITVVCDIVILLFSTNIFFRVGATEELGISWPPMPHYW